MVQTLYVLGEGQLGAMFVRSAISMGFPAKLVPRTLQLPDLRGCDALTFETENISIEVLSKIGRTFRLVPSASSLAVCQHRYREKCYFKECLVASAEFRAIELRSDGASCDVSFFPAILKTATLGYDGKGQIAVNQPSDLMAAWESLSCVPCILEKRVDLYREFSVIVARNAGGEMVHLPVQQNLHLNGILAVTQVPAPDIPAAAVETAMEYTRRIVEGLDYEGVLCIEYFLLHDGTVLANEMAPRPHNSGHYSIDACDISQFELQVRVLAELPLVQPRQHSPAVMLNLLGDLWLRAGDGQQREPDWHRVLSLPGVHLHLYGKEEARPGRKMGHLTITAADAASSVAVARQAAATLGIQGP
jgi:5-(carboxyamino)imidazole ribonucleotide synthase